MEAGDIFLHPGNPNHEEEGACVVCWRGCFERVGVEHTQYQIPAWSCSKAVLRSVSRILCPGCRLQAQDTGGKSQQGSLLTALLPFSGHLSQQAVARSRGKPGRVCPGANTKAQCSVQKSQSLGSKRPHSTPTQLCDIRQVATPPWASSPLLENDGIEQQDPSGSMTCLPIRLWSFPVNGPLRAGKELPGIPSGLSQTDTGCFFFPSGSCVLPEKRWKSVNSFFFPFQERKPGR